jgi:hypothetical protein
VDNMSFMGGACPLAANQDRVYPSGKDRCPLAQRRLRAITTVNTCVPGINVTLCGRTVSTIVRLPTSHLKVIGYFAGWEQLEPASCEEPDKCHLINH